MIHKLAHLLGWHKGRPYSFYAGTDLIMCFECSTCGDLSGFHVATRGPQ